MLILKKHKTEWLILEGDREDGLQSELKVNNYVKIGNLYISYSMWCDHIQYFNLGIEIIVKHFLNAPKGYPFPIE